MEEAQYLELAKKVRGRLESFEALVDVVSELLQQRC